MDTAMIARLQAQRDGIETTATEIVERASDENRDLTDDELASIRSAKEDLARIDDRIDVLADDLSQNIEISRKIRQIGAPDTDYQYRSAGQVVWDLIHQSDPSAKQRYRMAMRAAEHMGTDAAKTTPTAGDLGGLSIVPNVGAIVDPYPGSMPFVSAIGLSRISSPAFARPYVDDPDFEAGVAEQSKEKAELVSKKFDVKSTVLSPVTLGGYLNISQQLITLEPGSLSFIVQHLRKRLGWQIEKAALTEVAKTTGSVTVGGSATPTASEFQQAIYDAAAKVIAATKQNATMLVMGPLGFAKLGGLADLAGRPMFPYMGPSNAPGTSSANAFTSTVFGLRAIVSPAITDDSIYVMNDATFEAWWYPLPLLEAVEPSVLGRQVAVAAMFAPYRPTSFPNAIIKLTAHA